MLIHDSRTLAPSFFSSEPTFVDLLAAQVAASPNATALVCGEQELTYQELDERANRLAGYLISLGVQPNELVGVCINRSLDMVVAILGVIKSGGAYVPVDPAYPAERLSFILNDASARVVVTQRDLLHLFGDQKNITICMDTDQQKIDQFSGFKPNIRITPENLLYLIYTSGSTGNPKGVMITHSNLVNFVEVACSLLEVYPEDVYLQSATIAYALSVRQLMVPLLIGATVVVASPEEFGDPLELFKLIKRRNVTLMDVVPSFWRSCIQRLSDLPKKEQATLLDNSLRRIVSIGEALRSDLPHDWMDRFGHNVRLVNIFGQTETTGIVAAYPIPHDLPPGFDIVPIGRGATHTKIYLLDSNLQPVPEGEAGELCISNPCVAKGYLNRPELSAEKFILNPFDDGFSNRLYRTGDLARQRPDGNIEYLGRGDNQVKIRGQRLELGEVEATLRKHQAIRDCVVIARGEHPDDKYLAAYVVLRAEMQFTAIDLKEFLRRDLPEYMVPAVFMILDALPLNLNGKINRLALPDPKAFEVEEQIRQDNIVSPRNEVEETIARIWREALKLEKVGVDDNFFDLGGHSLMAVRVLTLIERDLGVRLPLTSFLHSATIAQLAELVDRREDEKHNWSPLVAIQTNGNKRPFFGIHAVGGGVLFWKDIVKYMPKDQPFYALQAQGVDGVRPALHCIEEMASLYINEIRKIQPHGPYSIGGFSLGGEIAFEIGQQLTRQGEKVNLLVLLDTRNPARPIRPFYTDGDRAIPIVEGLTAASYHEILRRKTKGHLRRLSQLGVLEKIRYIAKRAGFHIKYGVTSLSAKAFRLLRKRLPDTLLIHYLRDQHKLALQNYVPTLYPGRITIFRASASMKKHPIDSPMGWAPLAGAGLDIHCFEASHEIIKPEYAEQIARKLNECIVASGNE